MTQKCIEEIHKNSKTRLELIIIDNKSTDDTPNELRKLSENNSIRFIRNENETTYAKANNQGANLSSAKILLFLNNDVFVWKNWDENILKVFKQNPRIAIQGARLLYPQMLIQHCGIVFRKLPNGLKHHYHIYLGKNWDCPSVSKSREFQCVTGAFLAIRKEVFERVGGFDENYVFGHEDLDLCIAARKIGFKVWYNSEVIAYHLESMTKKQKGLENFELKLGDPNSVDFKNYLYFHQKWGDFIEVDDYKYYEEDGEVNPFAKIY